MGHVYRQPKMAAVSDHFDLQRLYDLFCACHAENDTICMDNYVHAYDEISKLLKLMGTVFSFVNSDVVEKIGILQDFRKSEFGKHYATIQSMIQYEVENKITNMKKKASGSRTLLRLHRALEFVSDFLKEIKEAEEHAKLSTICSRSYYHTLAKHHPWLIRKGVDVAVYTLPSRKHFMDKMKVKDQSFTDKLLEATADKGMKIFNTVEQLYKENNLTDLP